VRPPGQKPPVLPEGTVIDGRFELREVLGAGCFGAVYRARQLVFGHALRDVALKLFAADKVTPDNLREVFNDAVTLIALQEEDPLLEVRRHMIEVYDIGLVERPTRQAFMSMKLVPGKKTLEDEIRRFAQGGMPLATALGLLRQLLVPLAWMHALPVPAVHGDLKPDNVLVTPNGEIVLTDFGLAARLPLASLGGAIAYQAPETLLQQGANARSDVYGVGLIWYEMLTGRQPFHGVDLEAQANGDVTAQVHAHAAARKWPIRAATPVEDPQAPGRIPPASERHEELRGHPQLEAMLNRCLAYRQSDRYANARLVLADLDTYARTRAIPVIEEVIDTDTDVSIALPQTERTPEQLVADAMAHLAQRAPDRALACVERALRHRPGDIAARIVEAKARFALDDATGGIRACSDAVRLAPKDSRVLDQVADVLDAAGKRGVARSYRDQAAELRKQPRRRS
jgi:serine/threonine protein kinase